MPACSVSFTFQVWQALAQPQRRGIVVKQDCYVELMGLCVSSVSPGGQSGTVSSAAVRAKLKSFAKKEVVVNSVLLLGAGDAGKSTVFKQIAS